MLVALNLYSKTPFGQIDQSNPEIQNLADILDRTAGSVGMKLANFAAIDHTIDQSGLENYGKKDEEIWNKYWDQLDELAGLSEFILASYQTDKSIQTKFDGEIEGLNPVHGEFKFEEIRKIFGKEVRADQKRRLGQQFFRDSVLSNYGYKCCVCRLKQSPLLEAAHIVDWSETDDPNTRVDPRNGLAMCSIHHKSYDKQILTIDPESKVIQLSDSVKVEETPGAKSMFQDFQDRAIFIPDKFGPDERYLRAAG